MKKKELAILAVLLTAALVLGGIVWYVASYYRAQGLSLVDEREGEYSFNGKLLVSSDQSHALSYKARGRERYQSLPVKTVDLSPYGFADESFSYYEWSETDEYMVESSVYYAAKDGYEGFWPACGHGTFVYVTESGEKYRVHLDSDLSYPMFSDSVEGVDVYGKDVIAFSAGAAYAISLSGTTATIYHTDPMDDSLRIVDVKEIDLSDYGDTITFGAFVSGKEAYLTTETKKGEVFLAIDCESGIVAKSLLDGKGTYGDTVSRMWAQCLDSETKKGEALFTWANLVLGTERSAPKGSLPEDTKLIAVSGQGAYALGQSEKSGEIFVISEKRVFSLTSVLKEGVKITSVSFVYENMLAVSLTDENGKSSLSTYKICF